MMSNSNSNQNNSASSGGSGTDASSPATANNNNMIASVLLQDFYENNSSEAIASSGKILTTLLRNAQSSETTNNPKHGTIRLTNPKIQKHVVNVYGALDILGAAGFVEAAGGEHLNYTAAGHDSSLRKEREDLIQAICSGLEMKMSELSSTQHASASAASAGTSIPAPTPAAAASASNAADEKPSSSSFLSDKERQERQKKIKAMKKAKKAQRDAAKERWKEDMEERKLAAQRREALLNVKVQADVKKEGFQIAQNVHIGNRAASRKERNVVLPKPFAELGGLAPKVDNLGSVDNAFASRDSQAIRRQLIQQCMKDPGLTGQEKQHKIQELMRAGPETILAAASTSSTSTGNAPDTAAHDGTMSNANEGLEDPNLLATKKAPPESMDVCDNLHDQKQTAKKDPTPDPINAKKLNAARTISPPSNEWTQFVQNTPRCAAAEGIRDSSIFYRKASSTSAAADLAIPRCLKRLFKELDGLKDDLPGDANCSIWLRFDEETPQYMRALIAAPLPGPTPYSGGVFAFDIYIPNDYPQVNPKVQLLTTGGGRIRFGPNLYADGKVCLSLLGTWSGPKWNPKHSSLYQVLISIQGLILGVEHPYYLEPGHGGWEGKIKEGDFQVTGQTLAGQSVREEMGVPLQVILYEDALRVGTAKYAMLQPLRWSCEKSLMSDANELEAFKDIIQAHFCENGAAILAEVRNWMSDSALGRNRSKALERNSRGTGLQIDVLKGLLPKLEELLNKASFGGSSLPTIPTETNTDASMVVEEDLKPPARPLDSTKQGKLQVPAIGKKQSTTASEIDVVEQKRREMQDAAGKGDFILAGTLQSQLNRLEELQRGIQEAAQQADFIRAGHLQAQFKSLTETEGEKTDAAPSTSMNQQSSSAWSDEDSDDSEGMDWDDDGMDEGGPSFAQHHGQPHGLGSNVFGPPGYKSNVSSKYHSWGTGQALAASPAAQASKTTAVESTEKAAQQKTIPVDQLCRLRIRLPQDKSVVEDFDKNDSLAEVYRRLEPLVPDQDKKQHSVAGPSVSGGAFSQPLSLAGFTLLLTRPKREFSLEMHGTKTLLDLNLAPSATLTVMKCIERGVMYRGEVESRLSAAQGDAMDVEGLTYEGLMELTERVGKAAPREGNAFLTLTTEEFEANTEKFSPMSYLADMDNSTGESGEEDRRCPICLGSYDSSDNTPSLRKVKNCGHTMHAGCIQTWLRTNSSCPLCKVHIVKEEE